MLLMYRSGILCLIITILFFYWLTKLQLSWVTIYREEIIVAYNTRGLQFAICSIHQAHFDGKYFVLYYLVTGSFRIIYQYIKNGRYSLIAVRIYMTKERYNEKTVKELEVDGKKYAFIVTE